jgi:hypothetical protein
MARNEKDRYFNGPRQLIGVPVASATIIDKGDFVCIVSGYAVPASDVADAGTAAQNREAAADAFAGIAETATTTGKTDDIQVDISTHAQFNCDLEAAAAHSVGDLLEIYATTAAASRNTLVAGTDAPVAVVTKNQASQTQHRVSLVPQLIFKTAQT